MENDSCIFIAIPISFQRFSETKNMASLRVPNIRLGNIHIYLKLSADSFLPRLTVSSVKNIGNFVLGAKQK